VPATLERLPIRDALEEASIPKFSPSNSMDDIEIEPIRAILVWNVECSKISDRRLAA